MNDIIMDVLIILLGGFFFGMLVYGFYIVLKPTFQSKRKRTDKKPAMR